MLRLTLSATIHLSFQLNLFHELLLYIEQKWGWIESNICIIDKSMKYHFQSTPLMNINWNRSGSTVLEFISTKFKKFPNLFAIIVRQDMYIVYCTSTVCSEIAHAMYEYIYWIFFSIPYKSKIPVTNVQGWEFAQGFLSNSLIFCVQKNELLPSLFGHEWPEQIAYGRLFVKSNRSKSL